jgi:hypothetical protein
MPDEIVVRLDGSEYLQAMNVGTMRSSNARAAGRAAYHGISNENAEQSDITGAVGEACVAKHLNCFWLGIGVFRGPDVGTVQVRTCSKPTGRLILHESDGDGDVFVSVYAARGEGTIRGWAYGSDVKKPEYWQDPAGGRPAFFFPNELLRPMSEFPQGKKCP